MTYPTYSTQLVDDIDLNAEIANILYDSDKFYGHKLVLQSVLRDNNNKPIKARTSYELTGEISFRNREAGTTKTGYYCNEYFIHGMITPGSLMRTDEKSTNIANLANPKAIGYFHSSIEIKLHDVIVLVKLDNQGNVVNPVTPEREYFVTYIYDRRLDNSKREFYTCLLEETK